MQELDRRAVDDPRRTVSSGRGRCPNCQAQALARTGAGDAFCVECGYLDGIVAAPVAPNAKQRIAREVNERIADLLQAAERCEGEFLCECAADECVDRVPMPVDAYLALREMDGLTLSPAHRSRR